MAAVRLGGIPGFVELYDALQRLPLANSGRRRQTTLALADLPRVTLHFLPPYSPQFNPIKRVGLDLHADVTRNHRCTTIAELLVQVEDSLCHRNHTASPKVNKAVA